MSAMASVNTVTRHKQLLRLLYEWLTAPTSVKVGPQSEKEVDRERHGASTRKVFAIGRLVEASNTGPHATGGMRISGQRN